MSTAKKIDEQNLAPVIIPAKNDLDHRRCFVGGEPMLFHCHHYNTFLQRSLEDASDYVDVNPILIGAAAEVAYAQLRRIFTDEGIIDISGRKRFASELYRWAGFGTIDLDALTQNGGTMSTSNSHYAMGWQAKWDKRDKPVCFFAQGWIAGALAAIYDKPQNSYRVEHDECMACGNQACVFQVSQGEANFHLYESPQAGPLTTHRPRPIPSTPVDYDGILAAVGTLPLVGNENGVIEAFGVYLTRHYANYYNRIGFEFLRSIVDKFGDEGRFIAEDLLCEAGHVCAFSTFGGIMISPEWEALIEPSLETREDWVHGIIAVVNALGWGRWQVTSIAPEQGDFVVHDDYESVGYLGSYGESKHPVSMLLKGGTTGILNLVYFGNIHEKPALTAEFYNSIFRAHKEYRSTFETSRSQGSEVSELRVSKSQ